MMAKKTQNPHAQVTKRHPPDAFCSLLAVDMWRFAICQYAPAIKLNASTSERKRTKNTIFVRNDRMR